MMYTMKIAFFLLYFLSINQQNALASLGARLVYKGKDIHSDKIHYCELATEEQINESTSHHHVIDECAKNMDIIIRIGRETYYPVFAYSFGQNGILPRCSTPLDMELVACTHTNFVESECEVRCPEGSIPLVSKVKCELTGPLDDARLGWSPGCRVVDTTTKTPGKGVATSTLSPSPNVKTNTNASDVKPAENNTIQGVPASNDESVIGTDAIIGISIVGGVVISAGIVFFVVLCFRPQWLRLCKPKQDQDAEEKGNEEEEEDQARIAGSAATLDSSSPMLREETPGQKRGEGPEVVPRFHLNPSVSTATLNRDEKEQREPFLPKPTESSRREPSIQAEEFQEVHFQVHQRQPSLRTGSDGPDSGVGFADYPGNANGSLPEPSGGTEPLLNYFDKWKEPLQSDRSPDMRADRASRHLRQSGDSLPMNDL